ncbi:Proteins of 100 residues with WXG [Lachnospiraceae bacterium]|nr:Proteins of 100 residues with WXG [Lachnospiraceae bacterium]
MAGYNVKGNIGDIKKAGSDMQKLASDLQHVLGQTNKSVQEMEGNGFVGGAADQLTKIYTELSAELLKHSKKVNVLGENIEKSGKNLEEVERAAKSSLVRK